MSDRLEHDLGVWRPKDRPEYVTARDGDFYLRGQKWYPYGVNHMPASGIGTEDHLFFEHYLSRRAYDPEIFDRELARIKGLGMNMVSTFIGYDYHADRNLFDYLQRCDKYGLKVNLSLRPGTPMDFEWDKMRDDDRAEPLGPERHRLCLRSGVGAVPRAAAGTSAAGTSVGASGSSGTTAQSKRRKRRGASPCRATKRATSPIRSTPTAAPTERGGRWSPTTAASSMRSSTSTTAGRGNSVRSVDPHHLVSFRMTVAGDPTYNHANSMPYDFRSLIRGVDLFEPEGYGRIGDWNQVRPGLFTVAYARAVDPSKPVMWAEYGVSTWDMDRMQASPSSLDFQGRFYDNFLKMVLQSGANGAVCWWYPGGFRTNENSDFGILNPDGTDRPATVVLRRYAPQLTRPRDIPKPEVWIEFNPDDPAGIEGIYRKVSPPFWQAVESGKAPRPAALRTMNRFSGPANNLAVGQTVAAAQK